jgi:hypothetical protein
MSLRRFLLLALFLSPIAGLAGCATTMKTWVDEPLELAKQRLLDSPHDVRNHLELASMYMARHDYLRAQQYLSLVENAAGSWSAMGIDPEQVFRLGIITAVRSQQYGEAVRRSRQRLELGEERGVRELLASLLEALGEQREAEHQRRLLLLQYPAEPRLLLDLARFYERSPFPDRTRRARELYERYLIAQPEGPEATAVRMALRTATLQEQLGRIP